MGSLVFAIIEGPSVGWWSPLTGLDFFGVTWPQSAPVSIVPVALAASLITLSLFLVREHRRAAAGQSAVLDLSLFRLPTFAWGNTVAAMVAIGEFTILFALPLYLINALGMEVLSAGVILAAMALGAFFSGAAARRVAARFGSPGTVVLGLTLEVVGTAALALIIRPDTTAIALALPLGLYGLGLGLASAQLTGTVLRDVPVEISGQGSATQSMVRQVGSAFGTAISGATLSIALAVTVPRALETASLTGPQYAGLAEATRTSAGTNILQLRMAEASDPATDAILHALTSGFAGATRWALIAGTIFLLIGVAGSLRLRKVATPRNS